MHLNYDIPVRDGKYDRKSSTTADQKEKSQSLHHSYMGYYSPNCSCRYIEYALPGRERKTRAAITPGQRRDWNRKGRPGKAGTWSWWKPITAWSTGKRNRSGSLRMSCEEYGITSLWYPAICCRDWEMPIRSDHKSRQTAFQEIMDAITESVNFAHIELWFWCRHVMCWMMLNTSITLRLLISNVIRIYDVSTSRKSLKENLWRTTNRRQNQEAMATPLEDYFQSFKVNGD